VFGFTRTVQQPLFNIDVFPETDLAEELTEPILRENSHYLAVALEMFIGQSGSNYSGINPYTTFTSRYSRAPLRNTNACPSKVSFIDIERFRSVTRWLFK